MLVTELKDYDIVRRNVFILLDMDYFVERITNCCLLNLEDMLQNGTCINGTTIDKPHSFLTACNIATQAMASIASNQYGVEYSIAV